MYNIYYSNFGASNHNLSKTKPSSTKAIFYTVNRIEKLLASWRICTADNQVRWEMIDFHLFSPDVAKEQGIWWLCSKEANDRSPSSSYYSALQLSSWEEISYHHSFQIGWLYLKEDKFMSFPLPFSKSAD